MMGTTNIPGTETALERGREKAALSQACSSAIAILEEWTRDGKMRGASLYVSRREVEVSWSFGAAATPDARFCIASISKPMAVATILTLADRGELDVESLVSDYFPSFRGAGRESVKIRHLLDHTSGLVDELSDTIALRSSKLNGDDFLSAVLRQAPKSPPGEKFHYSSNGTFLAGAIAQLVTARPFEKLMKERLFDPLKMSRSSLAMGNFSINDVVSAQAELAPPEAGGGHPTAREWNWDSTYWRNFPYPGGNVYSTAPDIGRFYKEFLNPGTILSEAMAKRMTQNRSPPGVTPYAFGFSTPFGFGIDAGETSEGLSNQSFGHTGSTGTFSWADKATDAVFVCLTTLPFAAIEHHPGKAVSKVLSVWLSSGGSAPLRR